MSGSGLPPGISPSGAGGRQADSQTLCLPQTKSGKTCPRRGKNRHLLLRRLFTPERGKPAVHLALRNRGQISVLTLQLCLQPWMHRWHLEWQAIFLCALRKKSQSLFPFKFSPPVLFFRAVYPLFFGGFLPCVRFSEVGWDTYPTSEKKRAHRGNSGFSCIFTVVVFTVLDVYFQLQTGILQVLQQFFRFHCSTAEEEKQSRGTHRLRLCDESDLRKNPAGATAFAALLHL